MNISSLNSSPLFANKSIGSAAGANKSLETEGGLTFSQMVSQKLEQANSLQKDADQLTESFLGGGPVEIHQMLIAMEKADLALRETMEIRNKLVEAYKEIEKMQI